MLATQRKQLKDINSASYAEEKNVCVFFCVPSHKRLFKGHSTFFTSTGGETHHPIPLFQIMLSPQNLKVPKPVMGHIHLSRMAPSKKLPSTCSTRVGSSAQLLAEGTRENQGQREPLHSSFSKHNSSSRMSELLEEPLMKASIAP